ncbi:hypothetical protein [Evansella cellulosilytica]|uniref:Uncharacterized protein n=1 Tax=Evansella cellulosilytica (strain ATCC 21833 / DSM 2522 / FERM P-1141 / JCM 9156 / N-4) TaxID=649639 RepID=E6TS06_EVAC2|nr:hypothetical protein [Evansella cellulosilytica]ADU30660.1 hypothetical protein Bcell_2402 [Evansella cellulosilytica DSM 2522]
MKKMADLRINSLKHLVGKKRFNNCQFNHNKRTMTVVVKESFQPLHEMNQCSLKIISKR